MTDFTAAFAAAKAHARALYPQEMCGFVVDGAFVPVENRAPDTHVEGEECACKRCAFAVSAEDTLRYIDKAQLFLHSHPDGPLFPSRADMEGQMASGLPWGIIALDDERTGDLLLWGDDLPIAPILGRSFMHGVSDCYSLLRDTFRLGAEGLAAQGITGWPFKPILLEEYPRDDAWWEKGHDLYSANALRIGFIEISREEARPGDCFLVNIRTDKFNHAGVLLDNGLIMHHLPGRLSRREPAGLWARTAGRWMRYVGDGDIYA